MFSKKQFLVHKTSLKEQEEKGDFLYLSCQAKISPDDEAEEVYSILEEKVRNDNVENLLIQCNRCSNKILLTGFSILD